MRKGQLDAKMTIFRRRRNGVVAGLATMITSVALLQPVIASEAPNAQDLNWEACPPGSSTSRDAVCAEFSVPRDYANPGAGQIDITMSKIPATGTAEEYRGVIAGNPGGPGGSALGMFAGDTDVAEGMAEGRVILPKQVRRQYDQVAVQPRGHSWAGDMDCAVGGVPGLLTAQFGAGAMYQACEASDPGLVGSITTDNTARDLDVARQVLGQDKLNLYGLSYGGSLMSTYATIFPEHTDRMILDSSVAPSDRWFNLGASRLDDRRAALHAYFSWIAERDAEYHLGTTPVQVYQNWSDRVNEEVGVPAEVTPPAAEVGDLPAGLAEYSEAVLSPVNQVLDPAWRLHSAWNALTTGQPGATAASPTFMNTIYGALYDESSWPQTAAWIRDGIPAEQFELPTDDPAVLDGLARQQLAMPMVERAIICNENRSQVDYQRLPQQFVDTWTGGDVIGVIENNLATGQACAGWPLPEPARDLDGAALERSPLLLGYSRDNAVTGEAIHEVQEAMGGEKIVLDGWSHGVLIGDTKIVADEVTRYLS